MTEDQFLKAWINQTNQKVFVIRAKSADERRYLRMEMENALKSNATVNVSFHLADGANPSGVFEALTTPNLMKTKEVWFVENAGLLSTSLLREFARHTKAKNNQEPLENVTLALFCADLSRITEWEPVFKQAVILDLLREKPWDERARWVRKLQKKAHDMGCELTEKGADQLLKQCGNLRLLSHFELEKIALFSKKKPIDENLVVQLSEGVKQDSIWPLVRAIEQSDVVKAWTALEQLSPAAGGLGAVLAIKAHFQSMLFLLENEGIIETDHPTWQQQKTFKRLQIAESMGKKAIVKILQTLHAVDFSQREGELQLDEVLLVWFLKWAGSNCD